MLPEPGRHVGRASTVEKNAVDGKIRIDADGSDTVRIRLSDPEHRRKIEHLISGSTAAP